MRIDDDPQSPRADTDPDTDTYGEEPEGWKEPQWGDEGVGERSDGDAPEWTDADQRLWDLLDQEEAEDGPEEPGRIVLPSSQVYETAEEAGAEVVRRLAGGGR